VLEDFDGGTGQLEAENERCVIELIGDDETTFRQEPRQVQAVRREPHAEGYSSLNAQEIGDGFFELVVDAHGAVLNLTHL